MKTLFPSTLIIGEFDELIQQILHLKGHQKIINNPDIFLIDSDYSINQIRAVKKFFFQKPYNHDSKIVLIKNADNLEIPAQNALLVTLEDPGENNFLILTTLKPAGLLPTIISRCHQIKVKTKDKTNGSIKSKILIPTGQLTDLKIDKEAVLPFLEEQLVIYHQLLVDSPNIQTAGRIKTLLTSIDMIEHNVDPNLALDYFLLSS